MATFNLGNVFKQAFGYNPPEKATVPQAPARQTTSLLGQPYYATDVYGVEYFLPVTLNGYLVPLAVMSVTAKKTIVETPMPERGGAVTELISIDDFLFNIKGILITDDNTYPESRIQDIHTIFLVNQSVELRSVLSDIFLDGSFEHKVVIREVKWPAVTGVEHAKPFEIDCKSDMIFTLDLS